MSNRLSARSNLIYGDSDTGKTTQLAKIAEWFYNTTGKTTRLITGDGGGYGAFEDSGLVDAKIVDVFDYRGRLTPLSDIRLVSEGYWPKWSSKHNDFIVERTPNYESNLVKANVGCYMVESIASLSDQLLANLSERQGDAGFTHAWTMTEGAEFVGGLQMGHYGMVQRELYKLIVNRFGSLPVDMIFWSSLVEKGEDRKDVTIYGPKGAGSADTSRIPSWFGDTLHLAQEYVNVGDEEKRIRVAWYTEHKDATTRIPYLAKSRVLMDIRDKLETTYPNGFIPLLGSKRTLAGYYKRVYSWNHEYRTSRGNTSETSTVVEQQ